LASPRWPRHPASGFPLPAEHDLTRLRTSVTRGRPYGGDDWVNRMCAELGLTFTLRRRGRPPREGGDGVGLGSKD
jgi:hypothetical protein